MIELLLVINVGKICQRLHV